MIIYLCGGINGLTDDECIGWREHATKFLRANGMLTLDPMRRDYRGKEDAFVDEIVRGDYGDIVASEIILVNAMRPSWGTAMEVHFAFGIGKKVVTIAVPPISPWLQYHSHEIHLTLDDALKSLT